MTDRRTEAALTSALELFQRSVGELVDRSLQQLTLHIQSCTQAGRRQDLQEAERQLSRRRTGIGASFAKEMRAQTDKWDRQSGPTPFSEAAQPDWSSLSLVDDSAVERDVAADRLAQQLAGRCDASLMQLQNQLAGLQRGDLPDEPPPHPLRPQVVTKALLNAMANDGIDDGVIQTLQDQWGTLLPEVFAPCYEQLVNVLKRQGLEPTAPSVRRRASPPNTASPATSSMGLSTSAAALSTLQSTLNGAQPSGHAPMGSQAAQLLSNMFGMPAPWAATGAGDAQAWPGMAMDAASNADFQDLLRRIAQQSAAPIAAYGHTDGPGGAPGESIAPAGGWPQITEHAGQDGGATGAAMAAMAAGFAGQLMAPNIIRAHREELVQARGGAPLDQMIIDIVAALFDQVLSDPKVAPQVARQIARLQMPVLRVALSDTRFFSSRKHPVRRFVNRIANLSAAFDDLESGHGLECIKRITALVSEVVDGDFDRMDLYEAKLEELETFIDSVQSADMADAGDIQSLLNGREADLRVHQRYMQILQRELADVELPAFVRDFLTQIWSQVQVMASTREGTQSPLAQRMKEVGRELVLSVQPKGHPQLRKEFLLKLPRLMKDLNEGLALIQWPEEAKQAFFSQLLPAHAECLKAAPTHDLTQRLLEHQLNKVEQISIPSRDEAANDPLPAAIDDLRAPPSLSVVAAFTPTEAAQAGFVSEASLAEEPALDINLEDPPGTDPALAELDIDLDSPPPPSQGLQLVHHIQKGMAYQMMMQGQWKKVRLTWVSEGRTFFIFTQGGMHKKTISLTARTLAKMCDGGRFRAFEQAELIERATVRARRQLAALQSGQASQRPRDAA